MPFTSADYDERRWWRKFGEVWADLLAYVGLVAVVVIGLFSQLRLIERNEGKINDIVCGLRLFLDDLDDSAEGDSEVLLNFERRLPSASNCVERNELEP